MLKCWSEVSQIVHCVTFMDKISAKGNVYAHAHAFVCMDKCVCSEQKVHVGCHKLGKWNGRCGTNEKCIRNIMGDSVCFIH